MADAESRPVAALRGVESQAPPSAGAASRWIYITQMKERMVHSSADATDLDRP